MGIRFYCPQGHKLNVKAFLAGKRGICPKCGAKFEIPMQSVEGADEAARGAAARQPVAAGAGSLAAKAPVESAGGHPPLPTLPASTAASAAAPIAPAAHPETPAPTVAASTPAASIAAATTFTNPAPLAAAAPVPSAPAASSPLPAAPADPIAEAPGAVWYVRPASGGQFGPAAGEMMRQWITERRVGADSLVWREGWPEWQRAAAAFPQMAALLPTSSPGASWSAGAGSDSGAGEIIDDDWVDAIIDTKHPISHHRPSGRLQQSNWVLAISLIVIILGAILAIILVIIAMQQHRAEEADPFRSARARAPLASPALLLDTQEALAEPVAHGHA